MAELAAKLVPFLFTAIVLALMMALTMGVGWVSGKLIRRLFGLGGK